MFHFDAFPPLSLYVHIPWCVRKCPYCDFNSHPARGEVPEQAYVAAVLADLEQDLPWVWGRRVGSVFLGGGTPSLFSPEAVDRLLAGIRARLPLRPGAEITLEANPGTVEAQKFADYRAAGINRLSIGVQSFRPELLRRIGRIHGREEAFRAAEVAHQAGFDNFNLDLMFGLPGQSIAELQEDVRTAIGLGPAHISFYQLTLEPNTPFHHTPPPLPGDDLVWAMQQRAQALLDDSGYAQYEVSAFSRPGWRCTHNLNYWEFGDYLGVGAGAHAKLTDLRQQRVFRSWKLRSPRDYLDRAVRPGALAGKRDLAAADVVLEFMMNALRLRGGFSRGLFEARTGLSMAELEPMLARAQARELLDRDEDCIRPTALGRRFLNELLVLFMPDIEFDA